MQIKLNLLFSLLILVSLTAELLLQNIHISGTYLPNFVMCIMFSFAFHKPVSLWIAALGTVIGESFVSSTPQLMALLITGGYIFVVWTLPRGGLKYRNFHIIVFILITAVVYSSKILWLYSIDQRPEVSLMIIKMLVTIILFPLFYLSVENLIKLFKC